MTSNLRAGEKHLENRDQRQRQRWLRRMTVAVGLAGLHCSVSETGAGDAASPPDASERAPDASDTMLDAVAAIVVPNCAISGCHDSQSKEHGMDLSTARKIYDSWVNVKGLDHCRNAPRVRVLPGSAETSYVMAKIMGLELCAQSERMPTPPRMALSTEQIEVIRAWIAAGAPLGHVDAGTHEGGPDVLKDANDAASEDRSEPSSDALADRRDEAPPDTSIDPTDHHPGDSHDGSDDQDGSDGQDGGDEPDDGGTSDEDSPTDVSSDGRDEPPTADARPCVDGGPRNLQNPPFSESPAPAYVCTATMPCLDGLICWGLTCEETWECYAHAATPDQHPCSTNFVPYCGCNGVTFMTSENCPDRPYVFQGACDGGISCDFSTVFCGQEEPTCPAGQVPSVIAGFFERCVPIGLCRCETNAQCPNSNTTCDTAKKRCQAQSADR